MPIYEYQCKACGHRLEKLQKISDALLVDCPSCVKPELTKLVSAAAFRLKGGGWYETDFKGGVKKNVLSGDSDSKSSSDSNSSAGSDSSSGQGSSDSKPADSGSSGNSSNVAAASN